MTDTEPDTETTEEEVPAETEAVPEEDNTELVLRSWGLSGEPVTWASLEMQPVIAQIRAVNTGFADPASVQDMLDATYPDKGYQAANVALAHPPSAEFVIAPGDIDPDVDPDVDSYVEIIRVDLAADEDLGLPNEQVTWDFGDGTATAHDAYGWEHGYRTAGVYTVRCTVPVAGVTYSTAQEYTVGEPPEMEPTLDPGVAGRAATVFESETDDWPNNNAVASAPDGEPSGSPPEPEPTEPEADEPVEEDSTFDPADYTVDEVLAYVAEHPDETNAIRVLEESGKGRVGILDRI